MNKYTYIIRATLSFMLAALLLAGCSITSHLPQGEVLYTGVSRIDRLTTDTVDPLIDEQVALALEVQPNSALLGSAYQMSPLPWGLWIYNGLYPKKETGFRHWFWNKFKSDPTLVSQVNPRLRAQAAEAVLKDEGYFSATVSYDTLYHPKDSLRARLGYGITYRRHSHFGNITYLPSRSAEVDSIVLHTLNASPLKTGERFSASVLEAEKARIAKALNDSGYYFFQPDHIRFLGDSTLSPYIVDLRVMVGAQANPRVFMPCRIDSVLYTLDYGAGLRSRNFDTLDFVTVGYNGPRKVKVRHLAGALGFQKGALHSADLVDRTKTRLSRLNTFKFTNVTLQRLNDAHIDSVAAQQQGYKMAADTVRMLMKVDATYNYPWSGTTQIGAVYKDNNLIGPGITLSAQRRNLFGGGEYLTGEFTGAYEWMTGQGANVISNGIVNSWELGAKASLTVPRLQLPRFIPINRDNPVSSHYGLSFDWMRRAGLFEMIKVSGSVDYSFSPDRNNTFTVTPLRLTYVTTTRKSSRFSEMVDRYPSLEHSFENQFIPQLQFSWLYDNSATRRSDRVSRQYVNVTFSEAGGLCDLMMGWWGTHRTQGERRLFFQKFSQFLKLQAEVRHTQPLSSRLTLATRLLMGVGWAYGNSDQMPYSEMFYLGGPNSLRGFAVRGVGPGTNRIIGDGTYSYLNRVGDYKLELNAELRFPIAGSLYGALFADAGNVWAFSEDPAIQTGYGQGTSRVSRKPLGDLATDAGLGFRLDLGMLVLRFDVGVPLHNPNDDGGYFNCRNGFFRHLGYNLAVGYPF